jgi:hypothetical protein
MRNEGLESSTPAETVHSLQGLAQIGTALEFELRQFLAACQIELFAQLQQFTLVGGYFLQELGSCSFVVFQGDDLLFDHGTRLHPRSRSDLRLLVSSFDAFGVSPLAAADPFQ